MVIKSDIPRLAVFPQTAEVNNKGNLAIGGCDTVALAKEYGTPLYVFDETDLRSRCREYKTEFGKRYPKVIIAYSPKAFTAKAMLKLVAEEGLDLDIVTSGEMSIARAAGFPMERIHFPGNNKSFDELNMAMKYHIGHIVVDNLQELDMLIKIAGRKKVKILIRLNPGVDPHTHKYNTTGIADSKFGLPRGDWDEAVRTALLAKNLGVDGFHFHLGSGLFEVEPYLNAIDAVLKYAAELKKKYNFEIRTLSIGGGIGVQYLVGKVPPPVAYFAEAIAKKITGRCRELKLTPPMLIVEPGRKIAARAGMTLYTVGVIKEIPGIRTYVSTDGGISDNIRYAMYGEFARQEAVIANRVSARNTNKYTIYGKLCESGDVLIYDIMLPKLKAGDILAVSGSGAYSIPMQNNYNSMCRPAIVFVKDGKARLIRRRETVEDLMQRDLD
ncbi:MAG: diaminopimelate decarboxylase [Chloroflexi bacterium RBG_13_51_18]|nr:MAG: diaminopimelate decarboxylase [Chloroflexi bacterium RBG_13_51_18]